MLNERIESKPEHLRSQADKNRLEFAKHKQALIEQYSKSKISKLFSQASLVYKDCSVLEQPVTEGVQVTLHLTVIIPS